MSETELLRQLCFLGSWCSLSLHEFPLLLLLTDPLAIVTKGHDLVTIIVVIIFVDTSVPILLETLQEVLISLHVKKDCI